jgi:hypothetical protein
MVNYGVVADVGTMVCKTNEIVQHEGMQCAWDYGQEWQGSTWLVLEFDDGVDLNVHLGIVADILISFEEAASLWIKGMSP